MDVPGIGPKTLEKLALAGIKTSQDLHQCQSQNSSDPDGPIREEDPDLEKPGQSHKLSRLASPDYIGESLAGNNPRLQNLGLLEMNLIYIFYDSIMQS